MACLLALTLNRSSKVRSCFRSCQKPYEKAISAASLVVLQTGCVTVDAYCIYTLGSSSMRGIVNPSEYLGTLISVIDVACIAGYALAGLPFVTGASCIHAAMLWRGNRLLWPKRPF